MAMFLGGPGYAQVVGLYIQVDVPRVFVQLGGGGRGGSFERVLQRPVRDSRHLG